MSHPKLKFFIARDQMWGDSLMLRIGSQTESGKWFAAQGMEMKPLEEHVESPVALTLNKDSAQQLMDELWHAGIRPSEGSGSAGQLAATQAHLKDMQKLVFEVLKP